MGLTLKAPKEGPSLLGETGDGGSGRGYSLGQHPCPGLSFHTPLLGASQDFVVDNNKSC